jgi:hypothetical protein
MNFVLGFLLLVSGGDEIEVFWSFITLVRRSKYLMIGLFDREMPLLRFIEYVTEEYLVEKLPRVINKFRELEVPNSFWMTKWYMTLFLYNFPVNICLRIWDFFLVEGIFGIVALIVPIMRIFENDLANMEAIDVLEFF